MTVYGTPGASLVQSAEDTYRDNVRRGAFHEQRVAQALEAWLRSRADHFHLFHDLVGFHRVGGAGLEEMDLGDSNIDHVVLTGDAWLVIDAKGCGAGTLGVDEQGNGILVKQDRTVQAEHWLDDGRNYSRAGIPYRLTDGVRGNAAWIVPDSTSLHPSVEKAACRQKGGEILPLRAVNDGFFDQYFPAPQPPASPNRIARFERYLSTGGG
ncbi:nuclease-related domain-containing protein [Nocardiopsis chromatogenes]|uniref:nuclease-related domain-containing protein n=1 Tax=Nocardiopsis chromatogenes TaxID=280239 RepID=UPI001360B568|nr:nuclease-related domain-containing protein [Nocardiopsis chromatogenes]